MSWPKRHTSVDHHLATSSLKAEPHISLWAFEDRHWVSKDIFSSRSNATTFINHLVYKYAKSLTILNGLLTCFDLLKNLSEVQDWERYRELHRGSDWLARPAILELHSILTYGPLFYHLLGIFLKLCGYSLGCSLNVICFFLITGMMCSKCYLLLPTYLLKSSSLLKSLTINSYLFCLSKF